MKKLFSKISKLFFTQKSQKVEYEDDFEVLRSADFTNLTKQVFEFTKKGYEFVCIRTIKRNSPHFGEYKFFTAVMQKKEVCKASNTN